MKRLKITIAFGVILLLGACDVEYYDNPNAPSSAPTAALFNNNVKRMVDNIYDTWWSGRFTYTYPQYWHQTEYVEEDRYQPRETMRQRQNAFYEIQENFREIIRLNTEEATMDAAASSGANVNQVASCRILMAYLWDIMVSTWGDLPYWSYGGIGDPDFQALNLSGVDEQIVTPVYAPQDKIFADILNELSEAADQLDESLPGIDGDNLYHRDVAAWKKFANSLRLRIALRISGVNSSLADQHIADALSGGVFESNADNAMFKYEANDANASMSYRAWYVGNRSDFAVGLSFVQLLKGENLVGHDHVTVTSKGPNPFLGIMDPRLPIFAQPNADGDYVGMYVGDASADAAAFTHESLPGAAIIEVPDFAETLMEYAEVAFILSELNNWDQTEYENGIRASMEKWGVDAADVEAYMGLVPAASEENVLTQKYIALYMQGNTSWSEYRRTGYPHTLMQPFSETSVYVPSIDTWFDKEFNPIPDVTDLPYRMKYPQQEQTLNGANRKAAVDKLSNGDEVTSKLWWDVN